MRLGPRSTLTSGSLGVMRRAGTAGMHDDLDVFAVLGGNLLKCVLDNTGARTVQLRRRGMRSGAAW
jgi:hypothetical protein